MIQFPINIKPMGAVRMTQRSKWTNDRAKAYLDYKTQLGWEAKKHIQTPISGPIEVVIVFYYPIPKSWSKIKKFDANDQAIMPIVKPDIDNCVKGVFDALNGIAWEDDRNVVGLHTFKRYRDRPGMVITIKEVESA